MSGPAGTGPDVMVTATAWERFGDLVGPAAPEARWWHLRDDGTVHVTGDPDAAVPLGDAPVAEVVWLSNDVFRSPALAPLAGHLRAAPGIRWVQSGAAGTDSPLFADLLRRGVRLSTSHVTAIPIAEFVVGSVLRAYQRPDDWAAAAAERRWRHHDFREVMGTTWLVVGVGAIGVEVATRARALGATVVGVRRSPTGAEPVDEMVRPDGLLDVVPRADVVVLAAPAGPSTDHLVDATFLAAMAPGSLLVNVARGSLVDEDALREALDAGRPAGAVLDVVAEEPPPSDSWLWDHPRVTLTPHASGGGTGRFRRSAEVFAANLARYVAGEPLEHEVRA